MGSYVIGYDYEVFSSFDTVNTTNQSNATFGVVITGDYKVTCMVA